jgi:hypothetical protein
MLRMTCSEFILKHAHLAGLLQPSLLNTSSTKSWREMFQLAVELSCSPFLSRLVSLLSRHRHLALIELFLAGGARLTYTN